MLKSAQARDAIALWRTAFPEFSAHPPEPPEMLWRLSLGGQDFTLLESPIPHDFGPTPAWSFMVALDKGSEVDRIHGVLADGGGRTLMAPDAYDFASRFAWVEDRFAISWQLKVDTL
ncbi:MAG: VOC family protein [Pseudomonadota bacterium]